MPPPASSDEFLDLVRKSGVADETRLKSYLTRTETEGGIPSDPSKLAGLLIRDGLITTFQAEQILQGKWKRFFIGKYKVLERIGTGGMGQVFLCEHKLMRRRVAVKVLPAAKAQEASSLDRFYREAKAVAAMDHPNIVRAYDIDQEDHLHFLVMEYVDGTNLHDLIRKVGPIDYLRAAHYIYGSAIGLQHAHEMGLVHRDIKPGNILVDRSGVVKILDMGLARFFHDEEDHLTRKYDENILGTADYLAPEQAIDSHKVDIRADIYSLGGTFYYMLTGKPPFPEGTVAQKLLWHQTREPAAIASLRPDIPAELIAIVEKMMAKEPSQRYQTPAELIAALAGWVQTPIPPPEEKELPTLSPAAMNAGGSTSVRSSGPTTPAPVIAKNLAASDDKLPSLQGGSRSDTHRQPLAVPAVPNAPVATPKTAVVFNSSSPVQSSAPVRTTHEPLVQTQAEAVPSSSPVDWNDFASDSQSESKKDTDRPSRTSRRSKTEDPSTPRPKKKWLLLAILGGVGFIGLVGIGAVVAFFAFGRTTVSTTTAPAEAKKWYVSSNKANSPDPDRCLQTLAGALERAGTGDTIVILDERIEDRSPVRVTGRAVKKGVRVEAGTPSKSVVWSPKPGGGQQSVIEISDIENFQLSGIVIDASGSIDCGVVVGRNCPGLVVENVTVQSPKLSGFRFVAASGDTGRAIKLTHCRVVAGGDKLDSAIQVQVGSRFLIVEHCRLEGPGQAALKLDGPNTDVEIHDNRVFNFDKGVHFVGKLSEGTPVGVSITNNTFHTVAEGILVEQLLNTPTRQLTLSRNYFANTKQIARATGQLAAFKQAENARDKASAEGPLPLNAVTVLDYDLPPPKPGNDAEFLRPAAGKLNAIGPNKVPVGAQPSP